MSGQTTCYRVGPCPGCTYWDAASISCLEGLSKSVTPVAKPIEVAGAKKFDNDKPMLDLLTRGCPNALAGVGTVLTYGFHKYGGKHGWKALPDALARYEAALMRHILARASGETHDPESGLPHSHHIACNALFIAELEKDNAN